MWFTEVTSFPFHPDCTESSENSKIDDSRLLLGVGYERKVSGGRLNTKNHVITSKWKSSSDRCKVFEFLFRWLKAGESILIRFKSSIITNLWEAKMMMLLL